MTRISEADLLCGWLAANDRQPTPKEFGSSVVSINARSEGIVATNRSLAESAFQLREHHTPEQIADILNSRTNIIVFLLARSTPDVANQSLQYMEKALSIRYKSVGEVQNKFCVQRSDIQVNQRIITHKLLTRSGFSRATVAVFTSLVAQLDVYSTVMDIVSVTFPRRDIPRNGPKMVRNSLEELYEVLPSLGLSLYRIKGQGLRLGLL